MASTQRSTILVAVPDLDWATVLARGIASGHRVVCAGIDEVLKVTRELRPGVLFVGTAQHIAPLRGQLSELAPAIVFVKHCISSFAHRDAIELGAYAVLDTATAEWPTKLQRIVEVCVAKGRLAEPAIAPVLRLVPPQPRKRKASK